MHQPLISIIVPVYNTERFLRACLFSIEAQDFSSFEVLLVDDGSTDSSSQICKEIAEHDPRFKYFFKTNGGLSDARNFGIKQAKGRYLTFIDSDDWIAESYLTYLFEAIRVFEADISTCIYNVCRGKTRSPWKSFASEPICCNKKEALISLLYDETISISAAGKLFKRELFDGIEFPFGKSYEDVGTTYRLIQAADSVAIGGAPLYNYVMREDSIVHQFDNRIFDRYELAHQVLCSLQNEEENITRAAERFFVVHAMSVLHMVDLHDSYQREYAKQIRAVVLKRKKSILSDKRVSRRDALALRLVGTGLPLYQVAWLIYKKFFQR